MFRRYPDGVGKDRKGLERVAASASRMVCHSEPAKQWIRGLIGSSLVGGAFAFVSRRMNNWTAADAFIGAVLLGAVVSVGSVRNFVCRAR